MNDSMNIRQVVKQTGLTSRALRFYEAKGLVCPIRTASGARYYAKAELERLHQIIVLKSAGLSLAQMKRLFEGRPVDLAALLRAQLEMLDEEAAQIDKARGVIQFALSRTDRGEPIDAETFCSLIESGDKMMKQENKWKELIDDYYTPEEQASWLEQTKPLGNLFQQENYLAQWKELSARIEAAQPLAPESDEALAFVREWFTLLEPFSQVSTPEMWEGSRKFYADMPKWQNRVDTGFSFEAWNFISAATTAALAAGKDIGPVPAWMRSQ
ncbi:MerR family transcriptional regulator [Sphingorhabdus arenilitoris]|uniref:MerR family transcriptional regulator n=1 Tax=Sphingorhabdus arenilitoris TaxID=1490041 RepID=A0ABV8RIU1_9SPHN